MVENRKLEDVQSPEVQAFLKTGARFVQYKYCISIGFMTFRRTSRAYFIKAEDNAVTKGMRYTLLTLFLGWWGIPWGPIGSIDAIMTNLKGGQDVSYETLVELESIFD